MAFQPDEPLRIVGQPLFRVVGDEVFILMPDSKVHWLKNATAKALWDHLRAGGAGGITASELAERLSREFDVTNDVALRDVLQFLTALADRSLVARASGQAPD